MAFLTHPFGRGIKCVIRKFASGRAPFRAISSVNDYRQRQESRGEEKFNLLFDEQRDREERQLQKRNRRKNGLQKMRKTPLSEEEASLLNRIKAAKVSELHGLLQEALDNGFQNDVFFHTAMLKYNRNGQVIQSKKTFNLMRRHGITPAPQAFTTYFRDCDRSGDPDNAIRAFKYMKSLEIRPTEIHRDALIPSFASVNKLSEFLQECEKLELPKDIIFFGTFMKQIARVGDLKSAERLYSEMQNQNIQVNEMFCIAFMSIFKNAGDVDMARKYFQHFKSLFPGKIRIEFYNTYLTVLAAHNLANEVEAEIAKLEETNELTPRILANAYANQGSVEKVVKIIDRGLNVFTCLSKALYHAGRIREMPLYVEKYREMSKDGDSWKSIFHYCLLARELELSDELYANFFGPEVIPYIHMNTTWNPNLAVPDWDLHNYNHGTALVCIRYAVKKLNSGDKVDVLVGRGKHRRDVKSKSLHDFVLSSQDIPEVSIVSHPDILGRVLVHKL